MDPSTTEEKPPSTNGFHPPLPTTVGILFSDVKREYFPTEDHYLTEKDALEEAQVVATYLEKLGIQVRLYPGNADLGEKLKKDRPEMVFNLVNSVRGEEYLFSTIPALLELIGMPYTGAGIIGASWNCNKFLIQELLKHDRVPVADHQLIHSPSEPLNPELMFPLIAKLNEVHGGVEITQKALCENEKQLRERLKYLITAYKQPVLVEEFIVGKEITAILLEGLNKKVYLAEKIFHANDRKYEFMTFEDQWISEVDTFTYQKYQDENLKELVKKAFETIKMADYGKFDIRIDSAGRYYFIDANCNPAFGPKERGMATATILDLYGISFNEILKRLIQNTLKGTP